LDDDENPVSTLTERTVAEKRATLGTARESGGGGGACPCCCCWKPALGGSTDQRLRLSDTCEGPQALSAKARVQPLQTSGRQRIEAFSSGRGAAAEGGRGGPPSPGAVEEEEGGRAARAAASRNAATAERA
jgi:hypothetical protein